MDKRADGLAAGLTDWPNLAKSAGERRGIPATWAREFLEAERQGFRFQLKVRALVLALVAIWFLTTIPGDRSPSYAAFCGLLLLLGLTVDRLVLRLEARWWRLFAALLILLDVSLLAVVIALPNLTIDYPWPPQMAMRFFTFFYLPLYVMGSALTTSPALVLWTGVSSSLAWSACFLWVVRQPGTITVGNLRLAYSETGVSEGLRTYLDPRFVSVVTFQSQVILLMLGSTLLAFAVWRARRFLIGRMQAVVERGNLARFVSPEVANDLEATSEPGNVRHQEVAVMFVDIVGYTSLTERTDPAEALELLREFRSLTTDIVLDHGGSIDKFIGDAVMATFGGSRNGSKFDAARVIDCALATNDRFDAWNEARIRAGSPPIRIGIGVHCGEALVGSIGTLERLEHTVIGDVVNVASRLQQLTRQMGTPLVIGEAVFEHAEAEHGAAPRLRRFGPPTRLDVRGRAGDLTVRSLATGDAGGTR